MIIYKITNDVNNKIYVGKTNNFIRRYHEHFMKTNIKNVSIKAMTYNSLGDIGNNNAAEAYCVVMLRSK